MALPVWPAELPQKPFAGEPERERESNVLVTQMDSGPAKMRPTATADSQSLRFYMVLTKAQLVVLEDFYTDTVKKTLPFEWTDFVHDGVATYRFEEGAAPVSRFLGAGLWRAEVRLEQMP